MIKFTYSELSAFLSTIICKEKIPDAIIGCELFGFSSVYDSRENTVSWMKDQELDWSSIKAKVIICSSSLTIPNDTEILFVPVDNPRLVFTKVLQRFATPNKGALIAPTAIIPDSALLGHNVSIGHYCVIGENVRIGSDTVIHNHVIIYDDVKIGERCIVQSGTVIGSDGFGYEKDDNGQLIKIPHIGGVVIGDDVEIGSNTTIDRGTLSDTIIERNVKIDNLCHIAHNVTIGFNTTVIALSMIAGSVHVGKNAWIAPCSSIRDGVDIGDDAIVGMGSVVVKEVFNKEIVAGVPAKKISERRK